ncbi:hypothetical protein L227DRAFT_116145 [Lentinus tigrinus ALCF2SS1-6]|uniref:Uncharacterized protein n=1 Tax=Lentinus tigrinus ALCF2SS1-6 TaxID=1328759 RepID=A0A5C2S7X5_9APHY|nr:hypothetical protein L227DRAFT_116145 [Lentinus tigrinus ALCF2SS1-6]
MLPRRSVRSATHSAATYICNHAPCPTLLPGVIRKPPPTRSLAVGGLLTAYIDSMQTKTRKSIRGRCNRSKVGWARRSAHRRGAPGEHWATAVDHRTALIKKGSQSCAPRSIWRNLVGSSASTRTPESTRHPRRRKLLASVGLAQHSSLRCRPRDTGGYRNASRSDAEYGRCNLAI